MIKTFTIQIITKGNCDIVDITSDVSAILEHSGMNEGIANIFVSGSTAGITTVEYEPGLVADLKNTFEKLVPSVATYEHDKKWGDGNGHAHVRASLLGASLVIPFKDRELLLGTWQQLILIDFDNRERSRQIIVQLSGE